VSEVWRRHSGMRHEFVFILCKYVALHKHCITVVSVLIAIHLNAGILSSSQQMWKTFYFEMVHSLSPMASVEIKPTKSAYFGAELEFLSRDCRPLVPKRTTRKAASAEHPRLNHS